MRRQVLRIGPSGASLDDCQRSKQLLRPAEHAQAQSSGAGRLEDTTIKPRQAVRKHPELAGTYLGLQAAELAARGLRDSEDQRRFVAQVRRARAAAGVPQTTGGGRLSVVDLLIEE